MMRKYYFVGVKQYFLCINFYIYSLLKFKVWIIFQFKKVKIKLIQSAYSVYQANVKNGFCEMNQYFSYIDIISLRLMTFNDVIIC